MSCVWLVMGVAARRRSLRKRGSDGYRAMPMPRADESQAEVEVPLVAHPSMVVSSVTTSAPAPHCLRPSESGGPTRPLSLLQKKGNPPRRVRHRRGGSSMAVPGLVGEDVAGASRGGAPRHRQVAVAADQSTAPIGASSIGVARRMPNSSTDRSVWPAAASAIPVDDRRVHRTRPVPCRIVRLLPAVAATQRPEATQTARRRRRLQPGSGARLRAPPAAARRPGRVHGRLPHRSRPGTRCRLRRRGTGLAARRARRRSMPGALVRMPAATTSSMVGPTPASPVHRKRGGAGLLPAG